MKTNITQEKEDEFWIGYTQLKEFYQHAKPATYCYIVFCIEGTAEIDVNLERRILTKNSSMVLFPRDVVSVLYADETFNTQAIITDIHFLRESCNQLETIVFPFIQENFHFLVSDTNEQALINTSFEYLRLIYQDNKSLVRREIVLLQLRCFFLGLYDCAKRWGKNESDTNETTPTRAKYIFKHFMGIIYEYSHETREVNFYANKLCITPRYLNTVSKAVTQKTAKEIIDERIIMQLKVTLKNSNKSIQEISDEYHFPNQSYFGRYFKKLTGLSPTAFKKSLEFD